jgi:hypothetical protein
MKPHVLEVRELPNASLWVLYVDHQLTRVDSHPSERQCIEMDEAADRKRPSVDRRATIYNKSRSCDVACQIGGEK